MDGTRLRAIVREEIHLAVKTLADQMDSSDRDSEGYSFEQAASWFDSFAYAGACEAADEARTRETNPFEETAPGEAVEEATKTFVHNEVQNVLRELRDAFYMSGLSEDYRIAERLDGLITAREQNADE
jgi:hypothetical protein